MQDALGYIRVSSEEQADSGLGLEAQRQPIAAYCDLKGLRLVEVFEDPGISGGKPLASRPAGSQLLAAANKRKALVIVSKLDRLIRSVADAATVIADFDNKGFNCYPSQRGLTWPVRTCEPWPRWRASSPSWNVP
jgi:DNA invertase Pin-like site-specific DNA recombinase